MMEDRQTQAFEAFFKTVKSDTVLDSKTTTLVGMAVSMSMGCYPWMEHFLGVAREEGVSEKEIGAVQGFVMAVSAARVRAQFREVLAKMKHKSGKTGW